MNPTRWAVIGPGVIAEDFARALGSSSHGILHAVGGRDVGRAESFATRWGAPISGLTPDVVSHPEVDAVYVATVHTAHEEVATAALQAGKAVLCEKPLTTDPVATRRLIDVAASSSMPFLEAYKYRFGPLAAAVRRIIEDGTIGEIRSLSAGFGFPAATRTGRLFDPAVGGGAILDVGGYPVSLAIAVADWAGREVGDVRVAPAEGSRTGQGVDGAASAVLTVGDFVAEVETSIVGDVPRSVVITGESGSLTVSNIWGSRSATADRLTVRRGNLREEVEVTSVQPMAAEADAVSSALREGRQEIEEMPWSHSLATARVLGQWAHAIA